MHRIPVYVSLSWNNIGENSHIKIDICITKIEQDGKPSKENTVIEWGSGHKIVGSVLIKYFCMFCLYLQQKKNQKTKQNKTKQL